MIDDIGIEKVKCECGKLIKPTSMQTHVKSRKHLTYLQNPKRLTINHEKRKISFE